MRCLPTTWFRTSPMLTPLGMFETTQPAGYITVGGVQDSKESEGNFYFPVGCVGCFCHFNNQSIEPNALTAITPDPEVW